MIYEEMFRLRKDGKPYYNCYCRHPELIENYEKAITDKTQVWEVHHRKEEFYSYKELIERGEYFDVPPEDLIFLTRAEHRKIDTANKRLGEAQKNRKDQSKRVLCVETGEVFESISDAHRKTEVNLGHISAVCRGERKTAGRFHWRFV